MTATRAFLSTFLACALIVCAWGGGRAAEPPRPNIVIILFDDLGYGDLSCQGGTDIPTPRIDSIAANGARFTAAYSNGAFCTPTRAALIGCRYQQRFGIEGLEREDGSNHLPLAVNTLPERLQAVGYHTGFVGKWHIGPKPETQGFGSEPIPQKLASPPKDQTLLHGALAASFIEQHRDDKEPFFLYLALKAVHVPLKAPDEYVARFASIADEKRRMYAAMLATADTAVGMVLDALEKTGKSDSTLVFCTNDNGGPTSRGGSNGSSNAPLRGSKFETFEGGIRVPLLIRWPGVIKPGTVSDDPAITFDVSATALAAAGADRAATDGVDLRPFITGEKAGPPHEALYWRSRMHDDNHAVRKGDWKFVHSTATRLDPAGKAHGPDPPSVKTPAKDMLFNLADDPGEEHDLAAEKPEKLAELKKLYEAWSDEVDADTVALGVTPPQAKPVPPVKKKKEDTGSKEQKDDTADASSEPPQAATAEATVAAGPISIPVSLRPAGMQTDFPAVAVDAQGTPWLAALEWDGTHDTLVLAKHADGAIERVGPVGRPGIIHQPAIAADSSGGIVVVWSQVNDKDLMDLKAQRFREGKPDGEEVVLAASADGGNVFVCTATDRKGRVWAAWQSLRGGFSDIFCRWFDPAAGRWSTEVQVTRDPAGDWEPCLAFDSQDAAWVIFDSSRGNEFNIYAARVGLDGSVGETKTLIATDRYEARASAVGAADGTGIWLACERGNIEWGLDCRGHKGPTGLNGNRNTVFAWWDLASGRVEELSAIDVLLAELPAPAPTTDRPKARGNSAKAQAKAEARDQERAAEEAKADEEPTKPKAGPAQAINLPQVSLDGSGRPWLTVRYFKDYCWQIAVARFDADAKRWMAPIALPSSAYTQDKRASTAPATDGSLWLAWASDLRTAKLHRTSGVELARLANDLPLVPAAPRPGKPPKPFTAPPPYINQVTPERPRGDRHSWTHDGVTYRLYWGDFHRHTDISPCRTQTDGCVLEQFRYALDMGKLDMLGTSDHTDNRLYHPYEWWLCQKMVDACFVPGFFNSMYAYEREQGWPYGHRNVIFAQRGGPIVYTTRPNYLASPWRAALPIRADGPLQVSPEELWDVLGRYGKPVTVMSHTGATGMGTDWNIFDRIDHRVENVIEIFQGARVAYEGQDLPQPTVGLRRGEQYTADSKTIGTPQPGEPIRGFTGRENGLYQNALARGHKLGVWANSDHISTHTAFGGVYVKEFTREGIIEGINARRTIAATDKIFVEFTCNGQLLGSEIAATGQPALTWTIDGTAEVKQVTLVRNEENHRQWQPGSRAVAESFVDEQPLPGENRYYLRIEQADGNMAWSSPVWVNVKQP